MTCNPEFYRKPENVDYRMSFYIPEWINSQPHLEEPSRGKDWEPQFPAFWYYNSNADMPYWVGLPETHSLRKVVLMDYARAFPDRLNRLAKELINA